MKMTSYAPFAALVCCYLASGAESRDAAAFAAAAIPAPVAAAVADPARPEADTRRDANRKPGETLAFSGVKPGDRVGELLPGGGYFTRLLSKTVGPTGHVYAFLPQRPANAGPDMPDPLARLQPVLMDPAYANVSPMVGSLGSVSFPVPLDLVWTSQNYHDLHYIPGLDMRSFDAQVFAALKPGGIFLVLDHAAAPGSADRDAATLHRIDPETVKKEVLAAGFQLVATSDLLHNPDDPHTAKVFDPLIRGKTDQFILKFQKPAVTP
jgi:predicted methyltransferase